ncbi:HD domain-containing protein [Persephonella sp.]
MGKRRFLTDFSDISLLKLSAFFHDIGKIRTVKKRFKDRETAGSLIFRKEVSPELALGKKATEFVSRLIQHHLDVVRLFYLKKSGYLNRKQLNFFWYENKDIAVYLFVLTMADVYATSEDEEFLKEIRLFIIYLQEYYFDYYVANIVEEHLLSGKEIMEILGLSPSPAVGKVKDMLLRQQISGKIKSKEEAVDFIKSITL